MCRHILETSRGRSRDKEVAAAAATTAPGLAVAEGRRARPSRRGRGKGEEALELRDLGLDLRRGVPKEPRHLGVRHAATASSAAALKGSAARGSARATTTASTASAASRADCALEVHVAVSFDLHVGYMEVDGQREHGVRQAALGVAIYLFIF